MDKRTATVLAVLFGGLFLLFFGFLFFAFQVVKGDSAAAGMMSTGPQVGVVDIKGVIGDDEHGVKADDVVKSLRRFRENSEIVAIVLRIDSPGGAVAPSQEIFAEVRKTAAKKHVVVSMGNLAASGGYYIACGADYIIANGGTLTGSIGVISQFFEVKDLLEGWKVHEETIKSGKYKDIGSPFRTWSDADRAYFQQLIDDVYGQFVQAVADGRKLKVEDVRELAQGRVYTGAQAKEHKLVDALGTMDDALHKAATLAGATGEPRAVYPPKERDFSLREFLSSAFAGAAAGAMSGARSSIASPGLQVLWPGAAK